MHTYYSEAEIRNRMSISTLVFRGYRPLDEAALVELTRHGIRRIELLESPEQFDFSNIHSIGYVGEACRKNEIEIGAFHSHFINFSDMDSSERRQKQVDTCCYQIDNALQLGARIWGCHARAIDATAACILEQLVRHAEGAPITLAIENFIHPGMGVKERVAFLDEVNHPQLKMILDIGHVRNEAGDNPMTVPGGPAQMLKLCGHQLCHIHLHGFAAMVDHFPPLSEKDEIQWRELFVGLHESNYAGFFNFEPKGEPLHTGTLAYTRAAPAKLAQLLRQE